jgi:hypothetical protein
MTFLPPSINERTSIAGIEGRVQAVAAGSPAQPPLTSGGATGGAWGV